jgi:hypothetical protein
MNRFAFVTSWSNNAFRMRIDSLLMASLLDIGDERSQGVAEKLLWRLKIGVFRMPITPPRSGSL